MPLHDVRSKCLYLTAGERAAFLAGRALVRETRKKRRREVGDVVREGQAWKERDPYLALVGGIGADRDRGLDRGGRGD